jgi:hypothetical protein
MQNQKRELEESLARTRKGIQASWERWRRLHHERQTLTQRISAPQKSIFLSTPVPTPTATRSSLQALCLAESEMQPDSFEDVTVDIQPAERPTQDSKLSNQSQNTLHNQIVQGSRQSRYNEQCAAPSHKPLSAFKHHAVVSFSALSKYITAQKSRSSSQCNHQELRQAFLMCQTATAQRLQVPASEICWYLEWPYEGRAHQRLCTSYSGWSTPCKLTQVLVQIALVLECVFLVLEHELLSNAADPFFNPSEHPLPEAGPQTLPPRPKPPDPAALAAAFVRCGVHELVQLEAAMRRILLPLVRQFRGLLLRGKWLATCIQSISIGQKVGEILRSIPDQSPQAGDMHAMEASADQVTPCSFEVSACMLYCMRICQLIHICLAINVELQSHLYLPCRLTS